MIPNQDAATDKKEAPSCGCVHVTDLAAIPPVAGIRRQELIFLRWLIGAAIFFMIIAWGAFGFFSFWPFKTIDMYEPIQVLNEGKAVPLGGTLRLKVHYHKWINSPSTTIKTLIKESNSQVVDSITSVSLRQATKGYEEVEIIYIVPYAAEALGKCKLIVTINYSLFGVRHIMRIFETETFTVTPAHEPPPVVPRPRSWIIEQGVLDKIMVAHQQMRSKGGSP